MSESNEEMVMVPRRIAEQMRKEHMLMYGALARIEEITRPSTEPHVVGGSFHQDNTSRSNNAHEIASATIAACVS